MQIWKPCDKKWRHNDIITKNNGKIVDLRETKQIIYNSKGIDKTYPKLYFLLNLSHYVKSYRHLCQILAFFTMPALQIWPCHVTQEASLKKKIFFLILHLILGNAAKFLAEKLFTSEVISQKPHGGGKHPPVLLGLKKGMYTGNVVSTTVAVVETFYWYHNFVVKAWFLYI